MDVVGDDGDDHRDGHQEHRKGQVFAQQGHHDGTGRNDLGQHQEEHCQGQEDVDAQSDLLLTLCRQVEDHDCHEGVRHQRDNQVHRVEEELPLEGEAEGPGR